MTGVTTWYVKETGRNSNNGISEETAFKTLEKAIKQASKTSIKTIIVIGTITSKTIVDTYTFDDEILITGKPDATEAEQAVVRSSIGLSGILNGKFKPSAIKLEHITLNGNGTQFKYALLQVTEGAKITLGTGAKVINNNASYGGGVWAGNGATFVMESDAEISGNKANYGGGVYIYNATFIMKDDAVIKDNSADRSGGGVCAVDGSKVEMSGNAAIQNNRASAEGGGIDISNSTFTQNTGTVSDNISGKGSDINKE